MCVLAGIWDMVSSVLNCLSSVGQCLEGNSATACRSGKLSHRESFYRDKSIACCHSEIVETKEQCKGYL